MRVDEGGYSKRRSLQYGKQKSGKTTGEGFEKYTIDNGPRTQTGDAYMETRLADANAGSRKRLAAWRETRISSPQKPTMRTGVGHETGVAGRPLMTAVAPGDGAQGR